MILTRWSKSPERNRLREPRLPHDINADTSDRVRTRWQQVCTPHRAHLEGRTLGQKEVTTPLAPRAVSIRITCLRLPTTGPRPALHPITENEPPQDVPVALLLILGAVAHQRHPAPSRELLHQTQRKLLAMVLNGSAALVDRTIEEQLLSIPL